MISKKEEISISPIDCQAECNEDEAETDQNNNWYLEVFCTVVQRKALRWGWHSHGGISRSRRRRADEELGMEMRFSGTLAYSLGRRWAVVIQCTMQLVLSL